MERRWNKMARRKERWRNAEIMDEGVEERRRKRRSQGRRKPRREKWSEKKK